MLINNQPLNVQGIECASVDARNTIDYWSRATHNVIRKYFSTCLNPETTIKVKQDCQAPKNAASIKTERGNGCGREEFPHDKKGKAIKTVH